MVASTQATLSSSTGPTHQRPASRSPSRAAPTQGTVSLGSGSAKKSTRYEIVSRRGVAIRAKPEVEAEIVGALKQGEFVQLYEADPTSKWLRAYEKDMPTSWLSDDLTSGWVLVEHPTTGPNCKLCSH